MNTKKKKFLSFTLAELLVVTAIMFLILGVGVLAYNRQRQINRLKQSAFDLVSNLRKIQNWIQTGKTVTIEYVGGPQNLIPERGYGIFFDTASSPEERTEYQLFANRRDTVFPEYYYYEPSCDDPYPPVQVVNLLKDSYINDVQICNQEDGTCETLDTRNRVNIVFTRTKIFISMAEYYSNFFADSIYKGDSITIELALKDRNKKACVSLSKQGKVEVEFKDNPCF